MKLRKRKVLVLVLASLLLFSCDKKEPEQKAKSKPEQPKPASILNLVPEDTLFFAGGLESFPLKESLYLYASNFNMLKGLDPNEMLPVPKDTDKEGQRMAVQLWTDYYATLMSPETELESWGFEEKPELASYAIGLAPVLLRISLKDVQQFNKKIDELEAKAKVTTKPETLGKATYRRYVLSEKDPQLDMIIGVDEKYAVFMLDIGVDSQATLAMALGQQKPSKSLAQNGRVEALKEKYKLHPSFIGYIDHRQLITGVTTKDGNRIAKMIQALTPQLKEVSTSLNELQETGCRNDLTAIGENWPQTVFGYTALDLKAKPSRIESTLVVESNDTPLMEGLRSIRGFIPDYARKSTEPVVLSYGIGLNPENIAPFIMKQWTEITKKEYTCSFLKDMQQSLKGQNPAAVGMATGMAAGVRGVAFPLSPYDPD
ncbi:MAG: hypothetical protein D3924_07620 [Candidatus Electrothrix sp. AR4]|nr:hypothetical protein [Candidatus Electrothrix sp. AR4]